MKTSVYSAVTILAGIIAIALESQASSCGRNEVETSCMPSPACYPRTCWNYGDSCSPPFICHSGCVCANGYVNDVNTGKCVPCSTCRSGGCGKNAHWKECRSSCPPTCGNPNPICIQMCQPPGCQCRTGFVLNDDGKCIRPEKC